MVGSAVAPHLEVRRDCPLLKRRDGHRRLEGRAWRIAPLQCPVPERLQPIARQRVERRAVDAASEEVRVVGRQADDREHVSRTRIEHHRGAVETGRVESLFGRRLDIGVNRQSELLPGDRRHLAYRVDLAFRTVDHDMPRPVDSHQEPVV